VLPITHEFASHTYLYETRSLQQAADQRETHPPAKPPTFCMPHGALSLYSSECVEGAFSNVRLHEIVHRTPSESREDGLRDYTRCMGEV
jgi:hypothetical protein